MAVGRRASADAARGAGPEGAGPGLLYGGGGALIAEGALWGVVGALSWRHGERRRARGAAGVGTGEDPRELAQAGSQYRDHGMALTLIGAVVLAPGLGFLGYGARDRCSNGRLCAIGLAMSAGGALVVPAGAILWRRGLSMSSRARLLADNLSFTPGPGLGAGVALRWD